MLFLRSFVLELKERNTEQKHQKQVLIHQCFVKVFLVPWIPWLKFLHERVDGTIVRITIVSWLYGPFVFNPCGRSDQTRWVINPMRMAHDLENLGRYWKTMN